MALNAFIWNQSGTTSLVRTLDQCGTLYRNDSHIVLDYLRLKRSLSLAYHIPLNETMRKIALMEELARKRRQVIEDSTVSATRGRSGVYFMGHEVDNGLRSNDMQYYGRDDDFYPSLPPGKPMPPPPRLASKQRLRGLPSNNLPTSFSSEYCTESLHHSRDSTVRCITSSTGECDNDVAKGNIMRSNTESCAFRPTKRPRFLRVDELSKEEEVFLNVAPMLGASQSVPLRTNHDVSVLPTKP